MTSSMESSASENERLSLVHNAKNAVIQPSGQGIKLEKIRRECDLADMMESHLL